jgi:hypothetical protein
MKKLLLAFFIVSCHLVFAPTTQVGNKLTVEDYLKANVQNLWDEIVEERERETVLLQELNMDHRFTESERQRIREIAAKFDLNKDWIYFVIYKESRGNHKAVNKHTNATGLIQFLPRIAESLGTTTYKLRTMTKLQQLDYVEKYFERIVNKYEVNSYPDLYLSVFYPKAMGQSDSYIIGPKGSKAVSYNKGVDVNKDGILTVGDFRKYTVI